jgi:acyl-CoA reductase-like NAD-dependent aldehyde dehydrogenase
MYERESLYIGGRWIAPARGGVLDVTSPSTEQVIGHAPLASAADVDGAVAAAREAFDSGPWPRTPPEARAEALASMAAYLTDRARPLAELNIDEAGVPVTFAHARELGPVAVFNYFVDLTRRFPFRETRRGAMAPALVVREPAGVVAAVVPFNGPIMSAAAKIAPALAAGCPIVFKPAAETPLDAFVLAEAAEAAGVPPGVVNVLPGDATVGAALVTHPGVDRVVFTGSTQAGRAISQACAGSFKRLTLELGGKAAAVLLDDAPVEVSIASILPMSYFNSGQACIALSRILAPRARYDEVVDAAVEATRAMTVGDPRDPATVLGPVISARHRARVEGMIERARRDGSRIAFGGGRPSRLERGWYVEPTVFRDVDNTGYIAQNEVFGPVLAIIPHDGDEDAVALSNATPYGLSGAVFTPDLDRAVIFAERVKVGTFGINGYMLDFSLPFGGRKQSGIGREFGIEGLAEHTEVKAIALPAGAEAAG